MDKQPLESEDPKGNTNGALRFLPRRPSGLPIVREGIVLQEVQPPSSTLHSFHKFLEVRPGEKRKLPQVSLDGKVTS